MRQTFRIKRIYLLPGLGVIALSVVLVTGSLVFDRKPHPPQVAFICGLWALIVALAAYYTMLCAKWEATVEDDGFTWKDPLLRRHGIPLADIRGLGLLEFGGNRRLYVLDGKRIIIELAELERGQDLLDTLIAETGLILQGTRRTGHDRETYWARSESEMGQLARRVVKHIMRVRLSVWAAGGVFMMGAALAPVLFSGGAIGDAAALTAIVVVLWAGILVLVLRRL